MTTTLPAKTKEPKSARWVPFMLIDSLQDELGRFWPLGFGRPTLRERLLRGTRMSLAEIYEQGSDLLVRAELPGIKKEDINVSLQQGDLVIQGETMEEEEPQQGYYWRDRRHRSYYRRVRLPFEAQPELITAKYADGVLEVRIPSPVELLPEQHSIAVR
jgi:HSP20 family protein